MRPCAAKARISVPDRYWALAPDYGAAQSTLREADFCHARMCFFFTFCTDLTALKIEPPPNCTYQYFSILKHCLTKYEKMIGYEWL